MMKHILLAAAIVAAANCVSCHRSSGDGPAVPDKPEEPVEVLPQPGDYVLPIIQTTDVHGYIVNMDADEVHYRLAYVADKVKDIRGRGDSYDKGRLLLLDGGDLYQGASVSNLQSGKPVYVAMDLMEYDAVALGNHEFDWGFDNMTDQDATLPDYERNGASCVNEVPVVCANLYCNGARVPRTKDYVIVEKEAVNASGQPVKVKVGVIGYAIDYASSIMTSQFTGKGYSITVDYQAVNRLAASLESSGQCDATILLIHGAADYAAYGLGKGSPIDLVLGGHSHATMSGSTDWGMPYLQGGRFCEHYASADMTFSVDGQGKVSFKSVGNQKTPEVNAQRDLHVKPDQNKDDLDADILALSEETVSQTSVLLNEVIGYITENANSARLSGSGGRSTTMSNWMCDILRRIGGDADVSFVNSGGVRTSIQLEGQSKRDITVGNVLEIFPFNNTTYVYEITCAELLEVFEYSMCSAGKSLFSHMTGIECYFTDEDVIYALVKDGKTIYREGKWRDDWASRAIRLAVSEYLATTQREDDYTGLSNPLIGWNGSSRLKENTQVDNENAIRVLREEAAASGGLLNIDVGHHFHLIKP